MSSVSQSRELQVVDATTAPVLDFNPTQLDILRQTIAAETSDLEFQLFVEVAKRLGLDPFMRQIHAVMRNQRDGDRWVKRMTIQTGIDGYRLLASRTRELAGIDDAEFGPEDGEGHPSWARVTVWRFMHGQRIPFTATARWREYVQVGRDGQPTGMWAKMPYNQLSKCAEALALRRGFPAELSGIYTADEMMQADNPLPTPVVAHARITEEPLAASPAAATRRSTSATSPSPATATATAKATASATASDEKPWNGLADAKFRAAIKRYGYVTIEQTQQFLANARRYVPNLPDGSPEQARAYLAMVKADAERAERGDEASAADEGYDPPTDDDAADADEGDAYDLQRNPPEALRGPIQP